MKKIIRLNEEKFHNLVMRIVENVINEDHEKNNILYAALVLTDESKDRLMEHVSEYMPDWDDYKILCHHSTIFFHTDITDDLYDWCVDNEGKLFNMTAYEYGISDKAFAVKVDSDTPTANNLKHITIAVNNGNGGKPVDSNFIMNWYPMEPIELAGVVKIFYKRSF